MGWPSMDSTACGHTDADARRSRASRRQTECNLVSSSPMPALPTDQRVAPSGPLADTRRWGYTTIFRQ